jgi:hypothetical protein
MREIINQIILNRLIIKIIIHLQMELNYLKTLQKESGGFNYDNSIRNTAMIASKPLENKSSLSYTKTGTTICGVVFKVSI